MRNKDETYRRLITSGRWVRLRRTYLQAHPLCERCRAEGFVTEAVEVHHRVPVEHGVTAADKARLCFNAANLEALCHGCHVERHVEMGRSGKAATRRRLDAQGEELRRRFYGN